MRRADKEIASRTEIDAVIHGSEVCRLAFAVSNEPYLVPVSFGYDGQNLYFHTAKTGKKTDCLAANNRVCFEMERNVRMLGHPRPCRRSVSYESVIGYGTVHELCSLEEKSAGLNHILAHYSGGQHGFDPAVLDRTRVWRISISSLTGKRSNPGLTQAWA